MERLKGIVSSVLPVMVKIEWVPILLGALFREIGSPMVSCFCSLHRIFFVVLQIPAAAMSEAKRTYFQKDLSDWCEYAGLKLRWPDTFPIRTVLPLRVTLASGCDPTLITHICNVCIIYSQTHHYHYFVLCSSSSLARQ